MAEAGRMRAGVSRRSRCAIYTRKSTEEGLDQDFNSLDAQREACAAFVQSQKHEGWTLVPMTYDDGGYSGGSMERPALKRLLADIEAGQVDVVVVYKVDRLTRSLADFAKLVEIFDRCSVSFVSITQQFNTTTSMGRLTLNILLSFAQFERELIGERVRDKIAASKKKGMWMGGTVPLGYDVKDRKLVVNKTETKTVVDIYRRYVRLKSVRALKVELEAAGIRSKRRIRPDGRTGGNQPFSKGALYLLLQNRTYRGEATHKGNAYPGEHAAIIDKPLWDAVQATLAQNRIERTTGARTKAPSLLTGLLFDETGERLTPTWTVKKGTRYRYYVSTPLVTGNGQTQSKRHRIPAGDLETAVIERLRKFLSSPGELLDAINGRGGRNKVGHGSLLSRATHIVDELKEMGDGNRKLVATLVRHVVVRDNGLTIEIFRDRLSATLASRPAELPEARPEKPDSVKPVLTLTASAQLKRVGREMKLLVDVSNDDKVPDQGLLRIVARAYDVQARLEDDTDLTVQDVARAEGVTAAYVYALLRLRWLAPDIVTAIIEGRQPIGINAKKLMRLTAQLPSGWIQQLSLISPVERRLPNI